MLKPPIRLRDCFLLNAPRFSAIFIVLFAFLAFAQKTTNVIVHVEDPTGAVISGAEVKAVGSPDCSAVTRTDERGVASLDVEPGKYDVSVKMAGFRTVNKTLTITERDRQVFGIEMQIASCPPGNCLDIQAAPLEPAISLKIKHENESMRPASVSQITITLINKSAQRIVIYEDKSSKAELSGYRVACRDALEKECDKTYYQHVLDGDSTTPVSVVRTSVIPVPLQPDEIIRHKLDVNTFYDLHKPGTYTVWVELYDVEAKQKVRSNTLRLEVTE